MREAKGVLRNDGTLWLNIGDSYSGSGKGIGDTTGDKWKQATNKGTREGHFIKTDTGLKNKDLIGIPWMLAFALRADGWYLRSDIIWAKKNCMPESVTDRPTKAHEYIFLLSKSPNYYYDAESIMEPIASSTANDNRFINSEFSENRPERGYVGYAQKGSGMLKPKGNRKTFRGGGKYTGGQSFDNSLIVENDSVGNTPNETGFRNKRSVWPVATTPYSEAHFATFPEKLITDCIKAGCPEGGIVLDPFMGAGTTALVARKLNRNFVGIELNPAYIQLAETRLKKELGMFL